MDFRRSASFLVRFWSNIILISPRFIGQLIRVGSAISLCVMLLLPGHPLAIAQETAEPPTAPIEPALVVLGGEELFSVRTGVGAFSPQDRADALATDQPQAILVQNYRDIVRDAVRHREERTKALHPSGHHQHRLGNRGLHPGCLSDSVCLPPRHQSHQAVATAAASVPANFSMEMRLVTLSIKSS
ncbi:MAG: hypothetical protein AAF152_12380 [Cyanobacteria bacterium P01_A01_bin.114]